MLCPSSTAAEGSLLIGVVGPDGGISRIEPPLEVDDEFRQRVLDHPGRRPELRLRFAGSCMENACANWADNRCRIADLLIQQLPEAAAMKPCSIRSRCRWFAQHGAAACQRCDLVVHG